MRIAIFETKPNDESYIKKALKKHQLLFFKETIQDVPAGKYSKAEGLCVFIYSQVTKEILSGVPKLKLVVTRSTGFDHVNVDYCHKNGIVVGNVPYYGENTVAEHTFALLLNLSRNVHKSYERTKKGDYSIEGLQGFDLKGKTLGVIGVGHIGLHVIRIAKGFGMHVKAYDINKDVFLSEVLHYEYCELDNLLKTSDVISLHMPYNKHTHHFLNRKRMNKIKHGALIINTARGALIDTIALHDLLQKGKIGGAGLDVIEGEELIKQEEELLKNPHAHKKLTNVFRDESIFNMDNVIFTPHNAFNSKEAVQRILETTVENVEGYAKGAGVKHAV